MSTKSDVRLENLTKTYHANTSVTTLLSAKWALIKALFRPNRKAVINYGRSKAVPLLKIIVVLRKSLVASEVLLKEHKVNMFITFVFYLNGASFVHIQINTVRCPVP